jgi:hypothetical protein
MRLEVRRRGVKVTEELRAHLRGRLRLALGRFARHVDLVRVYLRDVNGPRGGVDKECRVVVHLPPRGRVVVAGADADIFAAVTGTAGRARVAVKRHVKRRRTRRRPPRRPVRDLRLVGGAAPAATGPLPGATGATEEFAEGGGRGRVTLPDHWGPLAVGLAAYVREFLPRPQRGTATISLPGGAGRVIGVFGNDGYAADGRVKREVAALRQRLQEAGLGEVGFGLSEDGHAWALLVGPGPFPCQTSGGGTSPEALAAFLEAAVWEAWRRACGLPPPEPSARGVEPAPCPASEGRPMIGETGADVR